VTVEQGLRKLAELLEEIRDTLADIRGRLAELEAPERLSPTGDPQEIVDKLRAAGRARGPGSFQR
jgi:hypothetical protein